MFKKYLYKWYGSKNKIEDINFKNSITFIILAYVLFLYRFVNDTYEFYVMATSIISLGIIIGFVYNNAIKNKVMHKKLKNLKRLYFLSVMIAVFTGVIVLCINKRNEFYYIFLFLNFQAILEYCEIENIFNVENKHISNIKIYIGFMAAFVIALIINEKDLSINLLISENYLDGYVIMSTLINLCMSLSTLNKILEYRKRFSMDELKKTIYYMCSITCNLFGFLFIEFGFKLVAVMLLVMKCIAFAKFYNYIIDKIRDEYFEMINYNIEEAVNTKKQLNSILLKRNKILNDTNVMITKAHNNYNKILDSIYGQVCLFTDDKLQYINSNMLKKFNIDESKFKNMDISIFLKEYLNTSIEEIQKGGNYILTLNLNNESIKCRVFLIKPNSFNKLLYFEDLREETENKKLKKEFEEFLVDDTHKKEFFANISHELKTPINIISSALQVNSMYLQENKISSVDKNRKVIMQNCLRLIRTINNFIDSNKISEGYVKPEMKVWNIVDLVENTASACNKYIEMFDNRFIFDSEEEEIYVECDKEFITRIVLNLLSNSIKYGKRGGVIKVNLTLSEGFVNIKIKNDGAKIDKETIPYMFDKFTKLNKAFNRIKEGSGLGLFLTKALVELQGGTINLTSGNKGNEFVIRFKYIDIEYVNENDIYSENFEINSIGEKVDIEFSDIYMF
ncbi:sensor histidine kinase KdpD [uncultured Clostridium sp.]|uniref:sensor histidine kinase n=1 Tax=uncultured Clostridium sp. TaxID=59620 RepID=UPI0025D4308D|nr:HAMP domain-containing sensor histidine kinase [uncultured Clostridium sp.]